MPTIPMHFCAEPNCPHLVSSRYCPEHASAYEHARGNYTFRRLYRTARWARLRALVLNEEPLCPECMADGLITPCTDVHHHKQKATEQNFFDRANLQALCHEHHSRHTQRGE